MIFYRAIQPFLQTLFGVIAQILKRTPGLREKSKKLWMTWEIRRIEGRPSFLKLDVSTFKGQSPIWIHAASGEFEYAKPIIREIRKTSNIPILVTYFSPTYAENVRTFPGVTVACPLPLDGRDELETFLDHFKPSALLIARTDAWPNTVLATQSRKIPILLFSATFTEQSKRITGLGRSLTRATLEKISQIQCVTNDDVELLKTLGLTNAKACGDSRYDQVLERLKGPRTPTIQATMDVIRSALRPRSFVAGSVWSEDLIPVLHSSFAAQTHQPHTLVLVPHEVSENFLIEIETLATQTGFAKSRMARLSSLNRIAGRLDILIVDRVGLLAELYQLGEVAFVGGSFRKTVHSVMEPLAAGCLTIVGPLHTNNREAIEFQTIRENVRGPSFVTAVKDTDEFKMALNELFRQSTERQLKDDVREAVRQKGGATEEVLRWLKNEHLIS